jgi:cell division protein FtsB
MKKLINFINKYISKVNKYQIAIVAFLVVTFFIGDNTLLDGIRYESKIKSLQQDIASCKKENEDKLRQLNALQSDKEGLEKFAREQFLMTKPGEDLFLITR